MSRGKLFSEEETISKAMELFWEKGYEATSLADLTSRLGIGKGSFYDTFGSKKALFNKTLDTYQSFGFETLDNILSQHANRIEGVRSFIDTHTDFVLSNHQAKGCFVANTSTACNTHPDVKAFLVNHNNEVKRRLSQYLSASEKLDNTSALVDLIITHATGISVMSKVIRNPERYKASNDLFMQLVKQQIN